MIVAQMAGGRKKKTGSQVFPLSDVPTVSTMENKSMLFVFISHIRKICYPNNHKADNHLQADILPITGGGMAEPSIHFIKFQLHPALNPIYTKEPAGGAYLLTVCLLQNSISKSCLF